MPPHVAFTTSEQLHQSSAPFSHFARVGELGFVSGLIGQRPADGQLVSPDPREQCEAIFANLTTLLREVGCGVGDLVRTTIYLVDYDDFETLNDVFRERLSPPYPGRTTLQIAGLPLGARFQLDAVVAVGPPEVA